LVAGVLIWQRSSSGPQHAHTLEADVGPPRTHIPTTITSAELADALFGSQASRYGNEAEASSAAIAANNAAPAQSETVAASREPSVPSEVAIVSSEHQPPSEEMTAIRAPAAAGDEPPATITVAAAIESAPLSARAELTNATSLPTPPSPAPSVPSKAAADPAAHAQAQRLVGQGDRQFADGNIATARLYYARAADLGFAPAASKLADTFDAQVLARHGVHGVRPNPAEVEKWRRRAAELGP
jgi:TPR repeat protein